ncbi:MAG: hypothetical protein FWF04_03530, partial [Clostridiales bacterium]|nr:hypothetical protein [Clostridiales bacterium]
MRKLFLILFCLIVLLLSSACSMNEIREAIEGGLFSGGGGNDDGYNYEASAERVKDTVTFYNGYLGISLTV